MTATQETTITAPAGLPFVDIMREFDAPPEAVYRAHVEPELFRQWCGPRTIRMDAIELNATTGGRWSYSFRGPGDMPFSFFGVFHSVEPNKLLVQTGEFNMAPGNVTLSTTRFEQVDGRTRLTIREVYPSVEVRDAAFASGMEHGIREGYERLDELVAR